MEDRWKKALNFVAAHDSPPSLCRRAVTQLCRWKYHHANADKRQPTINFHPDHRTSNGITVLEAITTAGRIGNQFETLTTNGYRLAERERIRARRESEMFGGYYDNAPGHERPKYGALNLQLNTRGGWPRFGSSHWVLSSKVLARCTATVGDSTSRRPWAGTYSQLDRLLADVDPCAETLEAYDGHRFRLIDGPVELQIHGDLDIALDVDALILDPSFKGTPIEDIAKVAASDFGIAFNWCAPLTMEPLRLKVSDRRKHACERLRQAAKSGEAVTAEWIGRDTDANFSGLDSSRIQVKEAAAKYLWNRLLLSQDQNQDRTSS